MNILKDSFGRTFPYIRMSITDICNFKCGYCLPNGYQVDKSDTRKFLHLDEIRRLSKCFSLLGVNKIRITGGEPTVRKDFFDVIKVLKFDSGIKNIAITTNGYHLDQKAKLLANSGLTGINISIDSLNQETFKNITGHDRLPEILKGIEILQDVGFKNIKINAVLLNGINSSKKDFDEWSNFIKKNKIDFRYIELMRRGNIEYFEKYHILSKIFKNTWMRPNGFTKHLVDAELSLNYINLNIKVNLVLSYSKDFVNHVTD